MPLFTIPKLISPLLSKITLIVLYQFPGVSPVYADFKAGGDAYQAGDYEKAAEEFSKVAEKGDHRAMYALGSLYAGGLGVTQDYKQAYIWFRKAAKYGRPDAMYKIGLMYEKGLGVKQNFDKALKWYGKSAKPGYVKSQLKVGRYYAKGLGVAVSNIKAHAWLSVALKQIPKTTRVIQNEEDLHKPLADKPVLYDVVAQEIEELADKLTEQEKEETKQLQLKILGQQVRKVLERYQTY